jgi:hypothetical protein
MGMGRTKMESTGMIDYFVSYVIVSERLGFGSATARCNNPMSVRDLELIRQHIADKPENAKADDIIILFWQEIVDDKREYIT